MKTTVFLLLIFITTTCNAEIFQVGPQRTFKTPSEVASLVSDGDIVEIDAGLYSNDVAVWRKHNLTIRGAGGRAHIKTRMNHAEGKGIWVIKGNNTIVENIEFSGARVPDQNGAGIRLEGANLTVYNCYFHDNENGILAGENLNSDILIENSEFSNNGYGDGYTHNIYVGEIRNFTMRFSYSHHAIIGHQIKSRAHNNYILYNRLMDERSGTSSYIIDLSNGGNSYVIGNLLQQGPNTDNSTILSYAMENPVHQDSKLFVINNTFVNDNNKGYFIRVGKNAQKAKIINNLFVKKGTLVAGPSELINNLHTKEPGLKSLIAYDYRPKSGSPVIDKGIKLPGHNDFKLQPEYEYRHKAKSQKRVIKNEIDLGAYEFVTK